MKYSLIGWLVFTLLFGWIIFEMSNHMTSLVRVSSFVIPEMALFYINLLWLSDHYLEKGRKQMYFLILTALVIMHVLFFGFLDIYIDNTMLYNVPHIIDRPVYMVFFTRFMASIPPLVISALLWKSLQLQREREDSMELKNQVLSAETKALKAQINPHFLFNSMNNIYSLSQMKSDKTGDAILQLAEIMRYVTYESDKDKVNLQEELKQIDNFIQLQFLKVEDHDNISYHIPDCPSHLKIAPMLLLPFIENSFKHSHFEDQAKGWINIDIQIEGSYFIMKLSNSAKLQDSKKDTTGGVGMENVKKRLSLIYPKKHKLEIRQDTATYNVRLELDLST
ncbi:MAG: histidine kinase [Crocinitomicaceae bacterium]|nr:histidine kinase [Crocinitomicaceae bacterium]